MVSKLVNGTPLAGSTFKLLDEHRDPRGSFTEVFQKSWNTCIEPVQWSVVESEARVFRGLHLHLRHDEYFSLMKGHCYVGLKDIRPDSSTYMDWSLYEFFEDSKAILTFETGILHGWYFTMPSIHLQAVSESYLDYGQDDNWGCLWNDPDLGIEWPFSDALLSERAQNFDRLEVLMQKLTDKF
jgi:dTDP-4-dehydrorhamnose 3,5-epimerase